MTIRSRILCATFFAVCLGTLSILSGEERPEWKFPEGDFAPMFPFKVEKGAPNNITNVQTWGTPWQETQNGETLSTHNAQFYQGETPFHFFGTNLCFDANFCEHADAERLAETLARFGIQVVRLHHMDYYHIWGKNVDRTKTQIDPDQLEKLDYLIAQLHKRGIFVNINLHVSRAFDERDGFEDSKTLPSHCKGVDLFEPRMIKFQKQYARDLLTHINPYTGYPYTDDPGVASIEINNENSIVAAWFWGALDTLGPTYTACLQEKWNAWLMKKYGSTEKCVAAYPIEVCEPGENQIDEDSIPEQFNPNVVTNDWLLHTDQDSAQKVEVLTDPSGKRTIKLTVEKGGKEVWIPQIVRTSLAVQEGKYYTCSFTVKTNRPTIFYATATEDLTPWKNLGFEEKIQTGTHPQTMTFSFQATKDNDYVYFSFSQVKPGIELELSDISFQKARVCGFKPDERIETGTFPILRRKEKDRLGCEPLRRDYVQFLVDLESDYWGDMYHFVKDELKAKSPVTGTQYQYGSWYAQEQTDYGDNHAYWQHPKFPSNSWDANDWYLHNKAMTNSETGGVLSGLSYNRVIGKAYTVSEYDHPYPNLYGAEGNLMIAAVAAFQGWSGIYQFAWSHTTEFDPPYETRFFDMCGNQAKMVHLPACYAILGRRDVQSGPGRYISVQPITRSMEQEIIANVEEGWNPVSNPYIVDELVSLVCWSGVNLTEAPSAVSLPADKINVKSWDDLPKEMGRPQDGEVRNEFGQLRWNIKDKKNGFFTIDTPGVKVFTGIIQGRSFDFHGLTLTPGKTRLDWTTVSITAADVAKQSDSERLGAGRYLIAATGLVYNTDTKLIAYAEGDITTAPAYGGSDGQEQVLCEGIPLTVKLNEIDAKKIRVFALDPSGNQKASVPVAEENGSAQFQLGPEYQTLWYELDIAQ